MPFRSWFVPSYLQLFLLEVNLWFIFPKNAVPELYASVDTGILWIFPVNSSFYIKWFFCIHVPTSWLPGSCEGIFHGDGLITLCCLLKVQVLMLVNLPVCCFVLWMNTFVIHACPMFPLFSLMDLFYLQSEDILFCCTDAASKFLTWNHLHIFNLLKWRRTHIMNFVQLFIVLLSCIWVSENSRLCIQIHLILPWFLLYFY